MLIKGRGRSRAAATSKIERFVTIIIKRSILDVAAALDPPLKGTTIWCLFSSVLCLFIYTYISQKVNEFVRSVGELFWLFYMYLDQVWWKTRKAKDSFIARAHLLRLGERGDCVVLKWLYLSRRLSIYSKFTPHIFFLLQFSFKCFIMQYHHIS